MSAPTTPHAAAADHARELLASCERELRDAGWRASGLRALGQAGPDVPDATSKFVIEDSAGRPEAVLICAPACAPGIVARGIARARDVAERLGATLGSVILEPALHGEFGGRSYSIAPWQRTLAERGLRRRLQRRTVAPKVLRWLGDAVRASATGADAERVRERLAGLSVDDRFGAGVRRSAAHALVRLDTAAWRPRSCLMHADLWSGNVLLPRTRRNRTAYGFYLIDWAASDPDGFGFWDLLSLSVSFGIGGRPLRAAVAGHCRALDCELRDAASGLALAVAELRSRLEHMPVARFAEDADRALELLRSVVPEGVER